MFCAGNLIQSASLYPGFNLDVSGMNLWLQAASDARKNGLQQVIQFDSGLALVQAANKVRKDALDLNALPRELPPRSARCFRALASETN